MLTAKRLTAAFGVEFVRGGDELGLFGEPHLGQGAKKPEEEINGEEGRHVEGNQESGDLVDKDAGEAPRGVLETFLRRRNCLTRPSTRSLTARSWASRRRLGG